MLHRGTTFDLFTIEAAFAFDVQVRLKVAEDLANGFGSMLASFGLFDAINNVGRGSATGDGVDDIVLLRNTGCDLRERLLSLVTDLNTQFGTMGTIPTRGDHFGVALHTLIYSMDQLLTGIRDTQRSGDIVKFATGSRVGLGSLRDLLRTFVASSRSFFTDPSAASSMQGVASAAQRVRAANDVMVANLRTLPTQLQSVVVSIGILVNVIDDVGQAQLNVLSNWGNTMVNMDCLMRKAPDLANSMAAMESTARAGLLAPLSRLGTELQAAVSRQLAQPTSCVLATPITAHARTPAANTARTYFAHFEHLCSSVQHLLLQLIDLVGPAALSHYTEFRHAIEARRFRRSARLLERSDLCTSAIDGGSDAARNHSFCERALATLVSGCVIGPRWIERPEWTRATGDVMLHAVNTSASQHQLGRKMWGVTTLELNVTITLTASAQCTDGRVTSVGYQLVQPRVRMDFYTNSSVDSISLELAQATVRAMHIGLNGQITVDTGAVERWWLYSSTLFVDTQVMDALALPVDEVCTRVNASTTSHATIAEWLPQREHVSINRVFGAQASMHEGEQSLLVTAVRSTPRHTLLASGLSDRPWPLSVAPGVACQARCSAGLSPSPIADELTEVDALPTVISVLPEVALYATCLQYLRRDYANCRLTKETADIRFAGCAGSPFSSDTAATQSWLFLQLRQQGVAVNESAVLVGNLDCETFTAAKAERCICVRSTDVQDPIMQNIQSSVGIMQDARASNRPNDLVAVRDRLWSLGYGRASFSDTLPTDSCDARLPSNPFAVGSSTRRRGFISIVQQELLTRVLLCASAGVFTFEDACGTSTQSPVARCLLPTYVPSAHRYGSCKWQLRDQWF